MTLYRAKTGCVTCILLACLSLLGQALVSQAGQTQILVTQQRTYGKEVRRAQAETAVLAAAQVEAYAQAAAFVSLSLLEQKLSDAEKKDIQAKLGGLARMLYSAKVSEKNVLPSDEGLAVTLTLSLTPRKNQTELLKKALARQDIVEMYVAGAAYQASQLARYDEMANTLHGRDMRSSGGMRTAHDLEYAVGQMRSMQKVFPLLNSYGPNLPAPVNIRGQMFATERQTPGNPLVVCALAEYALQDNDSFTAMKLAAKAIAAMPGYARAHNVMGTALLNRFLPDKALQSFSTAVSLAPFNPAYYQNRAMARLVLHDPALCPDLEKACALGECGMHEWATSIGKCGGKQALPDGSPREQYTSGKLSGKAHTPSAKQ